MTDGARFLALLAGPNLDRPVALGVWAPGTAATPLVWHGRSRTWRPGGTWMLDDFANGRVDVAAVTPTRARIIARDLAA